MLFCQSIVQAEVPKLLNFQGRLTDAAGGIVSGTKNIAFKIYAAENGGNELWSETQNVTLDSNGLYNVLLGEQTTLNLDFDGAYWIGIKVENDAEMTPLFRIVSSAYAFYALKSSTASYAQSVDWGNINNRPSGLDDGDDTGTPAESIGNYHIIDGTITAQDLSSGIDASSIGFIADKIDGYDASDLALVSHTHPGSELNTPVSTATYALTAADAATLRGRTYEDFFSIAGNTINGTLTFSGITEDIKTDINEHLASYDWS